MVRRSGVPIKHVSDGPGSRSGDALIGVAVRAGDVPPGTVGETYAAALQHDLVNIDDATLVGVVRRPTGRFRSLVDENHPVLGPPETLLEEIGNRREDLKRRGLCEEGAHNAAWEEVRFAARYEDHLDATEDAEGRIAELVSRVHGGEDVVLVCFEGENERCHRHLLLDRIGARLDG
jgi:hypothetical protein